MPDRGRQSPPRPLAAVPPAPTSAATGAEPRQRAAARYLWAMLLSENLCGLSATVPDLPRPDADHRLHQRCRHRGENSQSHRRIPSSTKNRPGARAPSVGSGGRTGAQRSSAGFVSPERTRDRVRSAHRLVDGGQLVPDDWGVAADGHSPVIRQVLRCLFGGPFCKSRPMPAQTRRLTAAPGASHTH